MLYHISEQLQYDRGIYCGGKVMSLNKRMKSDERNLEPRFIL